MCSKKDMILPLCSYSTTGEVNIYPIIIESTNFFANNVWKETLSFEEKR